VEAEAEEKAEAEAAELEAKAEEEKAAYDLCNEFRGIKNGGKNECFESTVLVFHLSIRDRHMCGIVTILPLIWKETDTRRHYTASTTKEARHCLLVSRFLSTITTPAAVVCSNRRGVQR
jgi:hypothetical protein